MLVATKARAIVGGQTSCKAPEMAAFEKHLPPDVDIISCHSLHGPGVDPKGQPLVCDHCSLVFSEHTCWTDNLHLQVIIKHRDTRDSFSKVESILSCFGSKHVHLTAAKHDRITADTQAVTHAAFLSMGAAWAANKQFPWEIGRYLGGIENVKINVTLRIYSNKWHVYAGLAILNPSAKEQIKQYATSVTELFKLMLAGQREELTKRIKTAGAAVFKEGEASHNVLLKDEVLDRFSLGEVPQERLRNNHLSLLGMVDCWWKLGIVPYDHMICSTPVSEAITSSPHLPVANNCSDQRTDRPPSSSVFGSERQSISSANLSFSTKPLIRPLRTTRFVQMTSNSHLRHG